MIRKSGFILTFLVIVFFIAHGQTINSSTQQDSNNRVQNQSLGISFAKVGSVTQSDNSTYRINLSSDSSAQSAVAEVSTSNKIYVDLPASYGGRLYIDSPAAQKMLKSRVMTNSVTTEHAAFQRDYWAVYAGMGMWDCVINCYTQQNGHYYIVSLVQEKHLGKPGEIVNGNSLTSEQLKSMAVSSMQDTTSSVVSNFNKLLSSFRISNQ